MPEGAEECNLEYGVAADKLDQTSNGAVSGWTCKVDLPQEAAFYRHTYLGSGKILSRGRVEKRQP